MSASQPLKAAAWMTGAIASFTSMAIAGRAVSFELDTFEIMTFRSLIGIAIVLTVAGFAGTLRQVTGRHLHIHAIRNLCHFAGQNLWFYAITAAPLALVFALEFTSPLWVTVLAPLVLGERLTRTRALAAVIGFAGILIIVAPRLLALDAGPVTPAAITPAEATALGVIAALILGFFASGAGAAAASAIGFAGSAVFTRLLTRTETITCILFYLTAMQAVFGLVCAGYDGDFALPSAASWPWLVLIGCAGLLAHFCMTNALAVAPATVVMPLDFARLPIIALVGWAFYAEALDPAVLIGAAVIFGANLLNIRSESISRPSR